MKRSPWGEIQDVQPLAPGVWIVSTAGHGGVKLDRKLNAQIPSYMRRSGGWYEEDVEWAIPFIVLADHITAYSPGEAKNVQMAERTLRNWYPDFYEKFYGKRLLPGESKKRDEELWYSANKHRLMTTSAVGDWHEGVPKGYVMVTARVGGRAGGGSERMFLIPENVYNTSNMPSFTFDEGEFEEV